MATAVKRRMTAREYLVIERKAEFKSELVDGELFERPSAARRHCVISVNLLSTIGNALQGTPCQVLTSDMRVKIEASNTYTYPDVTVACGILQFEDKTEDVLLNPRIIIEVVSKSTAAWDHGGKFLRYRQLPSLTDYVLVAQDGWLVEHYTRQSDEAWRLETLGKASAALHLKSIKARVALKDIYANTGLKPGVPPPYNESKPIRKR